MEEWSDFLFELLHRDVPPHLQVMLPQLLEADRQLFVIAAGMLQHGSIAKDGDVQPVYLSPVPKDVRKRVPDSSASSNVRSDSKRVRPASS
eukprot:1616010-Amphidinium_carterae.1